MGPFVLASGPSLTLHVTIISLHGLTVTRLTVMLTLPAQVQQHPQYTQQTYSQQQQHHPSTTYNEYATANGSTSAAPSMTSDGSSAPNVSPHTPADAIPATASSYDTTSSYLPDHYDHGANRWQQQQQQSSYGYDTKPSYNGYYPSPSVAGDYTSSRNALPSMRGPVSSSRERFDAPEMRHSMDVKKEPGEKLAPYHHAGIGSMPKPLGPYAEAARNIRSVGPSMPGGVNLIN